MGGSMYLISTYIKRGNVFEEHPEVVSKLNNTNLRRANLILDLNKKEVVKLRDYSINGQLADNNFDTLMEHVQATLIQ